ncbi:MAG: family 43 glycosylhydrolase [Candidatus Methylacidiphilales bacterium]|nr:family 43 glycosylhydrolase [Candidatus Methylacidiphilales bacterium]
MSLTNLAEVAAEPAETPLPLAGYGAHCANPILPGYYADPSLVQDHGKAYIYATLDPWGGKTLGCWESADFKNWTYRELNWPTKKDCTSKTSKGAMVWAPSVVKAADGKFYMYVSVGNEVWAGVADAPLGPWRNLLGDKPLIAENYKPGFHMIDAEAFIDDDGTPWLYWGSGLNWKNGKCWAVKLKPDMAGFDGEPKDVTPRNYFEGPFMLKNAGRYYLMYSSGITIKDTYQVHYAVGDNPLGPFTEGSNSPILVTNKANNVVSPGHHAVFKKDGQHYILYHRHSIPLDPKFVGRQMCVDLLNFSADGQMEKVVPSHEGPRLVQGRLDGRNIFSDKAVATASSQLDALHGPERVQDDNYATRWAATANAKGGWLQLDLGEIKHITSQKLRFEYAWKPIPFIVEVSDNGSDWKCLKEFKDPAVGSPLVINHIADARYIRLVFPDNIKGADISVVEWTVE